MRGELISLDLETTGLDVEQDSIIEIGAVRLRDGAVVEEFSTLVNPGFVISSETTHITGIHQDNLRDAPLLTAVLPQVTQFVGNLPVIAHNAAFDISFMRRFGTLKSNLPLDTYEIATILLPSAPAYSLSSLTDLLNIELENAHRALDDARATALLYWNLWERALALPHHLLYEITRAVEPFGWKTGAFFQAAYDSARAESATPPTIQPVTDFFEPISVALESLSESDASEEIDSAALAQALEGAAADHTSLESYETRPQQIRMAKEIVSAFNEKTHLMIEAGTGTGKSLAYLLPAARWALQNQQRVVITTNTINLQDQLFDKDVPLASDLLGQPFSAAVMKGRSNYLCPRRLASVRRRQPANLDEARTLAKILVWLQDTQTGDRSEISLRSGEFFTWNRMSAQDETCTTHRCQAQMAGVCPYHKARKRAEAAHVVIANHALVINDAVTDRHVLPTYRHLIVDEAHQFEDAITRGLGQRLDQIDLIRRLDDIGGVNTGLLGDLLSSARESLPDKRLLRVEAFIQNVGDAVRAMRASARQFFGEIIRYIDESGSSRYTRIRHDETARNKSAFAPVQRAWPTLNEFFAAMIEAMDNLANALAKLEKYNMSGYADYTNSVAATAAQLRDMRLLLAGFASEPDPNSVYWLFNPENHDHLSINSAPLHIGPLMEKYVWHQMDTAILTGATLQTANTFDYIKERLYGDNVSAISLGSPFDYKESTLIYLPEDMPDPNNSKFQRFVERGIVDLATALDGRVMVLFTSYGQLRETAANIAPRLALGNITVYDQASGGNRASLLENFKSSQRAVLLGTRSFWEGIDIPGDDLSAVVIVKLPFAVPSDPVFSARSTTYNDPFFDYAVPDAILRFRQGFGRLIRTRTDRGVVTIFDNRVINKSYGDSFLESLPDCTVQSGRLKDLANAAKQWLQPELTSEDTEL